MRACFYGFAPIPADIFAELLLLRFYSYSPGRRLRSRAECEEHDMRTKTALPVLALVLGSAALSPHRALAAAPDAAVPTGIQHVAPSSAPPSVTQALTRHRS